MSIHLRVQWRMEESRSCGMSVSNVTIIGARRPDIVIIDNEDKNCFIVDITIPGDLRLSEKESEKVEKYQGPKREITRMWNLKKCSVIPIIAHFRCIKIQF